MPEILKLYKMTITGAGDFYFRAAPKTYQGLADAATGVKEATDAEKAVAVPVHIKELLKSPYVTRATVYIKKADGKRTAKQLIIPDALFTSLAITQQGKPITTPAGTIVSIKRPRHRSRS